METLLRCTVLARSERLCDLRALAQQVLWARKGRGAIEWLTENCLGGVIRMTSVAATTTVYLTDYAVPFFLIPRLELDISLFEDDALVWAKLRVERNSKATEPTAPLELNIDELTLESVVLDGIALTPDQYILDERHLSIPNAPNTFELVTVCRIYPKQNTKLMGGDFNAEVQHLEGEHRAVEKRGKPLPEYGSRVSCVDGC
jgi:hypothetical protein